MVSLQSCLEIITDENDTIHMFQQDIDKNKSGFVGKDKTVISVCVKAKDTISGKFYPSVNHEEVFIRTKQDAILTTSNTSCLDETNMFYLLNLWYDDKLFIRKISVTVDSGLVYSCNTLTFENALFIIGYSNKKYK